MEKDEIIIEYMKLYDQMAIEHDKLDISLRNGYFNFTCFRKEKNNLDSLSAIHIPKLIKTTKIM